jgi:hypothetical protein
VGELGLPVQRLADQILSIGKVSIEDFLAKASFELK